ncbi:hypothetical protein [Glaciimonas immobilis]|uniref:Uncharacterized protein n=1 Tax=Glaciimonas immobilis TaxID=728004 RepID=A0A840RQA0_9BURK|nr:hypothetical protein [Glaciimonas immobilis]KAF3999201.1 hypothetical protein HAV38_04495 [Glaciimonas immobilis]MBB5198659.1 hypothetical protein [Glaciimonas immobilis]
MPEPKIFPRDTEQERSNDAGIFPEMQNVYSSTKLVALTVDEIELINGYRTLDLRKKANILGTISGTPCVGGSPVISIFGRVCQQVSGNITATQTFNLTAGENKKDV